MMQFHAIGILQALWLLLVANGAPIIIRNLLREHGDQPIDGGRVLPDGHPIFGPTKTIRGLCAAIVGTALAAPLCGLSVTVGALFGLGTMLGDLGSSFLKRRFGVNSSDSVLGLDQSIEALIPTLIFRTWLSLNTLDILAVVVAFFVLGISLSRLLYWLHIRKRPL